MAIANPWSITWAGLTVGGSSASYQLHGPYQIEKSFAAITLGFNVMVIAEDYDGLEILCEEIEEAYRKRDEDFSITIASAPWRYRHGYEALNSTSSISKPGAYETDRGVARMYRCTIQAELPADSGQRGLRELSVHVAYSNSRQRIVTMTGSYTASNGVDAVDIYGQEFDSEATTILSAIGTTTDGSATFELADESTDRDRNDHSMKFTRQYVELLADQSEGTRDDIEIVDHRISFSNITQHTGDSLPDVHRLRRVIANYSCGVDIRQTTDLHDVYENKIKSHIRKLFRDNFNPSVFCVEDSNESYDETSKRLSVNVQFLYQSEDGTEVLRVQQSLTYDESRSPDYSYAHGRGETDAYVDPGFATITRVWERTVHAIGSEAPAFRIHQSPAFRVASSFTKAVEAGPSLGDGETVNQEGWNIVKNRSTVEDQYVGDPNEDQIRMFILREVVVDQYNSKPSGSTSSTGGAGGGGAGGGGGSGGGGLSGGRGRSGGGIGSYGNRGTTNYGFGIGGRRR